MSQHAKSHATQMPAARRPSSARAATSPAFCLPASRPKSAKARIGAQPGAGPIMRPPWALDKVPASQGIASDKPGAGGRLKSPDALTPPKFQVSGHQRLHTPKGVQKNPTQRVIHGQWLPAEILGPSPPQRSRFDMSGGLFLKGISAAAWAKRERPKGEKTKMKESSKEESSVVESEEAEDEEEMSFNQLFEQDADDTEAFPEEILPDFDAIDMEMERLRLEAADAERQAQEKLMQAQEQAAAITPEQIELTRKLVLLEVMLERAVSESESDSSDEDMDEDEEEEKNTLGDETVVRRHDGTRPPSSKKTKPDKSEKTLNNMFQTRQRANQQAIDQMFVEDVKKKVKDGGLNKQDYISILSELQIIGGDINIQDAYEAFDCAKRPTDNLMDIDGFVESVQYLRSRFGIESQQFDELNIVVDDAKRQIEVAQATFAKIGDALGDMRMVMAKRNLDRTAGDAKVKEVNSLNFENLNAEKEIELLQDAQKMLYGAISDYTAAMVQDEIKPVVQKIMGLNVRLARLQANRSNFRCANVMIRQTLLLCSKYEIATAPPNNQQHNTEEQEDSMTGLWPAVEDTLDFAANLYEYSEELKDDSIKCLQHAQQRLLVQDYDATLTSLLVCEALERDALLVRGVSLKNKDQVCVLMPCNSETIAWNWTWMEQKRSDAWHATANSAIDHMYNSVKTHLEQGLAGRAGATLKTMTKFTQVLALHNPGESLMRAVETARRDQEALEALGLVISTAQRSHHYASQLEKLLGNALDKCSDADDYRDHGEQKCSQPLSFKKEEHDSGFEMQDGKSAASVGAASKAMGSKQRDKPQKMMESMPTAGSNNPPHASSKVRFWQNKWHDAGKDALSQVVSLGIDILVAKTGKQDVKQNQESDKTKASSDHDVQERINSARALLDTARQLLVLLLDRFEGPEAGKDALPALLRPLENALSVELEGRWSLIYDAEVLAAANGTPNTSLDLDTNAPVLKKCVLHKRMLHEMKSAEVKLKERDLKATRLLLDRARKIYVEGTRLQILARQKREAQHEADHNSANVSQGHEPRTPKAPSASKKQHGEKQVPLPAEWHTMQAKVESQGAAGLARARTNWIQVSTKLQIVNGCVDFLNLSMLIQNVKLDKTARADSDSDSDTYPIVKDATERTPEYANLDHAQMLEKLRKAMSLTQSEILSAVEDWHQNELEMLDYCKVRLLSSGEGVAKQGDTLPYFMFVLKGSLKLVLPDPNLEDAPMHIEGGHLKSTAHQVCLIGKALRGMNFNFGQAEPAHQMDAEVQSKDLAAESKRGHIAYFSARRILGEAHVALQKPYYAHIVAMQDETEVLEFHVPPDTLTMLKSSKFSCGARGAELTIRREEGAPDSKMDQKDPSSDKFWHLTSADERVQAAHKSLANAFLQVRDDVESLERGVNLALHKSTYSVGYSKILTSLSSSLLQVLLEGSLTLKCNENQVLMQQGDKAEHTFLIISGRFQLQCSREEEETGGTADSMPAQERIGPMPKKALVTESFELEAGDMVGEDSFTQSSNYTSTCRCTKQGKVLKIALWSFQPILRLRPSFLQRFARS